jgi:hypothetical protein
MPLLETISVCARISREKVGDRRARSTPVRGVLYGPVGNVCSWYYTVFLNVVDVFRPAGLFWICNIILRIKTIRNLF